MNNIKHALYLKIIKAADALMLTVPFLLCWFFYYADRLASPCSIFGGIGLSPPCFCSSIAVFGKVIRRFLGFIEPDFRDGLQSGRWPLFFLILFCMW